MEEGRWRGWDNAEIYDRFVRERGIYRWLNQQLIERADLARARRVLDLGCGTGATTASCLAVLPVESEVVGIDASAEMIEVARAQTLDPRARFLVGDAGAAAELVEGPFDRAVSNAAFWQFPARPRVLAALARLLEPGGRFVFNVPAERVATGGTPLHPFQVALARAIGDRQGAPFVQNSTPFDPAALREDVRPFGLEVVACERLEWEGAQAELMELMQIPAMIAPITQGLNDEEKRAAIGDAKAATDPGERVRVPWLYLAVRRR